jgi:CHAT domain-containing protein/Tfp pilus assembly protein PilF
MMVRTVVIAVAIVCTMSRATFAQDPHADIARAMSEGSAALKAGRVDEARQSFERAVEIARAERLEPPEAAAMLSLAEIDFRLSRYDHARSAASQAHDIADRLGNAGLRGRARYYLGLIAKRAGQADDAFRQFEGSVHDLTAADDPLLASALRELLGAQRVHPVSGADRYRQAIALAERSANPGRIGGAWHMWGDQLFAVGEYEGALEKYEHAIAAFRTGSRSDDLGTVYNSLGRLYRRHGQLETALDYQQRALRIHEKSAQPFFRMQSLNAVGVTLQALGRYRDAQPYLKRALAIAREAKNARMEDFVGANLTISLLDDGRFAEAADLLEGVLARNLDVYRSQRFCSLARAYLGLGRLDQALQAAEQSVKTCGDEPGLACIDAYDIRARAHFARQDRVLALADLERALGFIEEARRRLIPADFFKQRFDRAASALYGRAIELQLADGQARQALETAEQVRARAFLDLLASRNIALAPERAAALNDNTSQRRSDLTAPPPKRDDLAAIAARLQSTLLVYWVATDRVFIWTVSPGGNIHATTVTILESQLADLVAATAPFGAASSGTAAASPWRVLYDTLIAPVRAQLPATPGALVTIVPHGPLTMLSFAALRDQRSRYLIEDYTLHYTPAAGALQFTARRETATAFDTTLVVADPRLPRRSRLERQLLALPGARAEARSIARLAPSNTVVTLTGAEASEARVRELAADQRVLHFATHAIVNDEEPFASFLALAKSDETAVSDGTLTAQDIYGLQLKADLVVLSACRSGSGRVTGDGLATFARAFLSAGAPSLITSVWDVADESTSHLIPEFYRAWRGGASKAAALRAAQLKFLKELRGGTLKIDTAAGAVVLPEHPALWAGFTLIGEPQ